MNFSTVLLKPIDCSKLLKLLTLCVKLSFWQRHQVECTQCNVMQSGSEVEQQPQKQFSSSIPLKNQSAFNNVVCRHLLRGGCHGVRRFPRDPGVAEERLPSQGHLPRPQQGRMAEGLRPDRFAGAPLSHPDTPGLAIKSFFAVYFLKKNHRFVWRANQ